MLQIPCQRIMDQNFQLMTMIMIAHQNVVLVPHHMEEDGGFTGKTGAPLDGVRLYPLTFENGCVAPLLKAEKAPFFHDFQKFTYTSLDYIRLLSFM